MTAGEAEKSGIPSGREFYGNKHLNKKFWEELIACFHFTPY
jgi:hypothetical protein